jgi:DNA-binding transcriptional MerR regulator
MNKYITIKDASNILGMSKITLRNWDKSGKLKAHRHPFNNYRVYKLEDIDKVIEMIESVNFIIKKKKNEIRKLAVQHLEEGE